MALVHAVFFLSGFASLLYQIVWQRALFRLYGTNVESVTLVVTAFMLGLGLGSLAGGALSAREGARRLRIFAAMELGVGAYGLFSLPLFGAIGNWVGDVAGIEVGLAALAGVLVPTLLMGATLPLLVAHAVHRSGNVGRSVGGLYFTNTLGAAAGSLAAGVWALGALGETGAVRLAAATNAAVGLAAWACAGRGRRAR
jgi:MFS family permease